MIYCSHNTKAFEQIERMVHMARKKEFEDTIKIRIDASEKKDLIRRLHRSGMDMSGYIRTLIERDKEDRMVCKH